MVIAYKFYVNEEFYKESQVVIFGDVIFAVMFKI